MILEYYENVNEEKKKVNDCRNKTKKHVQESKILLTKTTRENKIYKEQPYCTRITTRSICSVY